MDILTFPVGWFYCRFPCGIACFWRNACQNKRNIFHDWRYIVFIFILSIIWISTLRALMISLLAAGLALIIIDGKAARKRFCGCDRDYLNDACLCASNTITSIRYYSFDRIYFRALRFICFSENLSRQKLLE